MGAWVAVVVAVPLAGLLAAARRSRLAGSILGLPAPGLERRRALLIVGAFALLAVAVAQPALERELRREVRTDAEALVVIDVSRSMAAAESSGAPTRLDRAKDVGRAVRSRLEDVPTGVATFTDRVLPHLLPTANRGAFEATLGKTVGIERPAARDEALQATNLQALGQVVQGRYFSPQARRRLLVVVTDGESASFDQAGVARALASADVHLELVLVGGEDERVYAADGSIEPLYRPAATAGTTLAALAAAADGVVVEGPTAAARAAADFLGRGPTRTEGVATDVHSLAWLFAAAAFVPLVLLLAEGWTLRDTMPVGWLRPGTR